VLIDYEKEDDVPEDIRVKHVKY